MNRSPSWSDQLHEVLNSTDENMARIKQTLYPLRLSSTASLKLLQEGPKGRALLEQRLERLRKELKGLRNKVQELVQTQMRTRPGKFSSTSGFHQELQTEHQLLWEESEILREELKLLRDQLSQHQELLLEQMAEGRQVQARSWKTLEHLQRDQKSKVQTLEFTRTEAPDAQKEDLLRTSVHARQSKLPLATIFAMSVSSSNSEVSLPDCDRSWELLKKLDRELQNTLSNLEPRNSQPHGQSLGQEDLFLQGPKVFQSDL